MRLLVDMNLSPAWVPFLEAAGFEAVHWSSVGAPNAPDQIIADWARRHQHILFTHDLDFGAILAVTNALGPSVIQIRTQDVLPTSLGDTLVKVLRTCQSDLETGALVTVDKSRSRVRILPVRP